MIDWMIRHFIKDSENTSNLAVREQYGILAGIMGITSNLFLFVIKFTTAMLIQSIAIMADAVNNLSDAGSSVITLIGFKISSKPADEKHPFGHARMEYISGLVVSFIIILLGVQLVGSSFEKILKPNDVTITIYTIVVLIISIAMKMWQGLFNKKLGKKIDSTALQATATDSLNDVLATAAVLISALVMKFTGVRLDGWMGMGVALFIIISGIQLVAETINPLLGLAPSPELIRAIRDKIINYEGIIGMHDLAVHNYGPERCFASVHVEVPASEDILVSHDVIDNIERDFLSSMNIHMVIHLDPVENDNEENNRLREIVREIVVSVYKELSMHDFRMVAGTTHTNLIFDVVVPTSCTMSDKEIAKEIDKCVKKIIGDNYFTVITVDHNYAFLPFEEDD